MYTETPYITMYIEAPYITMYIEIPYITIYIETPCSCMKMKRLIPYNSVQLNDYYRKITKCEFNIKFIKLSNKSIQN